MLLDAVLEDVVSNGGDSPSVVTAKVPTKVSTEALKGFIATMHNDGCPDSEIAARFGYNRAYIQQLRSGMGLLPNRGKVAPKFSEGIDLAILRLRDEDDMSWAQIAREVDRQPRGVAERYNYLDQRRTEETEKGPVVVTIKRCLVSSCRRPFETMDRKKEWYCGPCRDANSTYGNYMATHDDGCFSSLT